MKEDIDCLVKVLEVPLNILDVLLELIGCPLEFLISAGVGGLQQVLPVAVERLHGVHGILHLTKFHRIKIYKFERQGRKSPAGCSRQEAGRRQ